MTVGHITNDQCFINVMFSNTFWITPLYIPLKLIELFYDVSVKRMLKKIVNGNFLLTFFSNDHAHISHYWQ